MSKFETIKTRAGHHFNLKADNGEIILTSEKYESHANCLNGIDCVRQNSQDDSKFELKKSKDKKHYFVLKAKNGQVIGVSEMYESKQAAKKGVSAVKKCAANAPIDTTSIRTGMPPDLTEEE